jgi:HlyD family secretion protein
MATDRYVGESESVETKPGPRRPTAGAGGSRWGRGLFVLLVLAALGGGGYYLAVADRDRTKPSEQKETGAGHHGGASAHDLPRVEVVKPKRGGMEMTTVQPGTVHAFEYAQLYAKVSGYVKVLNVDRGSRVKVDDLLVSLYVPELVAAVEQAKASLIRARASVDQAKARVQSAQETINAKIAHQNESVAILQAATSQREYREKQYARIKQLVDNGSVEKRLLDEEEDRRAAARASEFAAKAGVETARAQVEEAKAMLSQAQADVAGAMADVKVSQANLDEKQTWEAYTQIKSPYNGVVIFRGEAVHPGAFIQSADKGMNEPLLTVAQDDRMRTVIPVPDRDVPFCDIGDPAIIHVDALHDREFKGTVSRIAESEDVNDRTMRVEVDLPNPQHRLRDGMYGRAVIVLEKSTPHLTVPSSALLDRDSEGKGTLEVVRDGKLYRQAVVIGRDDGTLAEIISGLDPNAAVVVKPDVSMTDGTPVEAEAKDSPEAPDKT